MFLSVMYVCVAVFFGSKSVLISNVDYLKNVFVCYDHD